MIEVMDDAQKPEVEQLVPFFEQIFEFTVQKGYLAPKIMKSRNDQLGIGCSYHEGTPDHIIAYWQEFKDEVAKLNLFKTLRC